jgi:hypothetical protein
MTIQVLRSPIISCALCATPPLCLQRRSKNKKQHNPRRSQPIPSPLDLGFQRRAFWKVAVPIARVTRSPILQPANHALSVLAVAEVMRQALCNAGIDIDVIHMSFAISKDAKLIADIMKKKELHVHDLSPLVYSVALTMAHLYGFRAGDRIVRRWRVVMRQHARAAARDGE